MFSRDYRARAEAVRALADATTDPLAREELASMERAWLTLAGMADRQRQHDRDLDDDLDPDRPDTPAPAASDRDGPASH